MTKTGIHIFPLMLKRMYETHSGGDWLMDSRAARYRSDPVYRHQVQQDLLQNAESDHPDLLFTSVRLEEEDDGEDGLIICVYGYYRLRDDLDARFRAARLIGFTEMPDTAMPMQRVPALSPETRRIIQQAGKLFPAE